MSDRSNIDRGEGQAHQSRFDRKTTEEDRAKAGFSVFEQWMKSKGRKLKQTDGKG